MNKSIYLITGMILALLISNFAQAQETQEQEDVTSELKIFRVDNNQDGERLIAIDEIEAGDTVEYQLTYKNNMEEAITNLKPELPVPNGMQMVPQTAKPSLVGAALQSQGTIQSLPIRTQYQLPNGETVTRDVSPDQFKRVQWMVNRLAEGESVTLSVRMLVTNPGNDS